MLFKSKRLFRLSCLVGGLNCICCFCSVACLLALFYVEEIPDISSFGFFVLRLTHSFYSVLFLFCFEILYI